MQTPFAIGECLVCLIAYLVRDWRVFTLVSSLPCLLSVILLYFVLPESPRWLISKGRYKEAKKIMLHAAKMNKVKPKTS